MPDIWGDDWRLAPDTEPQLLTIPAGAATKVVITDDPWIVEKLQGKALLCPPTDLLKVDLAEGESVAMIRPVDDVRALLPNDLPDEAVQRDVVLYNTQLTAPLAAGTVLGEIRVSADGVVYGVTKLVNSSTIELSRNAYLTQRLGEILSKGWVIALIAVLLTSFVTP